MHSIYRLFKHTYFMLLRNLQNISQLYTKYTENALFTHDNNDDIVIIIVIIAVIDNDDNLKIKKKFSFK